MTSTEHRLRHYLDFLYGWDASEVIWQELNKKLGVFRKAHPDLYDSSHLQSLTQKDAILITYGDQVREPGRAPLCTLGSFLHEYLDQIVSTVHILPFYPYSSDDGFSIIDYMQVNPDLGTWEDIQHLGKQNKLMFDAVINHISSKSEWFKGFLNGKEEYQDFFINVDPQTDLSQVFRPRTLPLLTAFDTIHGKRYIWTTFSKDQVDLNFTNPQVLLRIVDVFLFYVANKASFIRLDAIAFLWKSVGTSCLHLPQTHVLIKVLRAVLDLVAPSVVLITETNVPHLENISYFGDGLDEAQMVYNFALPPLVLYSFHKGDAGKLSQWASSLTLPSKSVTYFNFLASHDGIGVTPARGILTETEIEALVDRVLSNNGFISYRNMPDGSQIPYEMNINYLDALAVPDVDEPLEVQVDRFVTAHAIMLALVGVPGIYFHSLFGSRSWREGVKETGMKRSINRQKFTRQEIEHQLNQPSSLRARILNGFRKLLQVRANHQVFNPYAPQLILDLNPSVFSVLRGEKGNDQVICLHNVSHESQTIKLDLADMGKGSAVDLLSGTIVRDKPIVIQLKPYQTAWLELVD